LTEVVDVSPVSEKGQVTIPKQVRYMLNVKPGDRIVFVNTGTDIIVRKARTKKLSEILSKQKPLDVHSLAFQRKARAEWNSS
jgi:AbrB family looped-hinge helix DNA binding protein